MNPHIQHKIDLFKKMATTQKVNGVTIAGRKANPSDGLSKAIHTKKDADIFMAELKAAARQAE